MSQRRGVTLLELLIVAILMMGMIGAVTSFFAYMPHWANVTGGKLNLMREESSASSMLQGEIDRASACSCPSASTASVTNGATGEPWEYYLVPHPGGVADRYELRASKDGGSNWIKVAGMVKSFTCTERPTYNGVDLCVVYETSGLLRREMVQFRRSTPRTMEIDIADLDRDGFKDLVTVRPAQTVVQTYKGDSSGTWTTNVTASLNPDSQPRSIEIVDFDGNGKLDLAVLTIKDIQILEADPSLITNPLVNGVMSYTVTQTIALPAGAAPISLASGDLDNDGAVDLVASDAAIKAVRLLYGNVGGNKLRFNAPVRWPIAVGLPGIPHRVRVANMNTGGVPDVVIGLNTPTIPGESIVIGLGSGNRSTFFGAPTMYLGGDESWDLEVGDIDSDSDLDVVSADWTRDRIARLLNTGAGALGVPAFTTTVSPTAVAFLEWSGTAPKDVASVSRVRGSDTAVHVFPGPSLGTTISSVHFPVSQVDGISIVTGNVSATNYETWAAAWMTADPGGVRFETSPVEKTTFRDLALGDVNRDGKEDLVMVHSAANEVNIRPGTGTGTFTDNVSVACALPGGTEPIAVRAADLDRDGDLDLVVATTTNVQVLKGTGAASLSSSSFGAASSYTAGTVPKSLAIGDFNRDGIPDAAVTDSGTARVSILIGNGTGGFNAPSHITLAQASFPVAILDLNRDGIEDLVVGHRTGSNVLSVLTGTGTGAFNAPVTYAAGAICDALAVADLTRDGIPDVIAAERATNTVRVIPGTSTGTLNTGATATVTTDLPVALAAVKFNADPFPDIAVVNKLSGTPSQVTVHLGTAASPWLTAQTPVAIQTNGVAIAAGDLNRDGRGDWVAAWMSGSGNNYSKDLAPTVTYTGTRLSLANKSEWNHSSLRKKLMGLAAGDWNRDGKGDFVVITEVTDGGIKPGVITFIGSGTGTFAAAPPPDAVKNDTVQMVESADANRDGKPDLLVSAKASGKIYVPRGVGDGTWDTGGTMPEAAPGTKPYAFEHTDYNRDGKVDYISAGGDAEQKYAVAKGDGTGISSGQWSWDPGQVPWGITAGDLDRNGYPDLVACFKTANQLRIRLHDGTANDPPYPTEATPLAHAGGPVSVALGDFNMDGILDVVTANETAGDLTFRSGTGTGTFNAVSATITGLTGVRRVRVADMNMDGKPDLVACGGGSYGTGRSDDTNGNVWTVLGNGDGTFGGATAYPVSRYPWDIRVVDFNQDDRPDVVVSHNTDDTTAGGKNDPAVARVWMIPGTTP